MKKTHQDVNLSISNLAFRECDFRQALDELSSTGIKGIEIAPTLLWDNPAAISKDELHVVKRIVNKRGLHIIGLQSLFYKQDDLQIFKSSESRENCQIHLRKMAGLCSGLGGGGLVFGNWNNRRRDSMGIEEAFSIAGPFFHDAASAAGKEGLCLAIEPLSEKYGCDFITTVEEAAQLVNMVDHPHFKLIVDTGCMHLNDEDAEKTILKYADLICHVHINDPFLSPPSAKHIDHMSIAKALSNIGYDKWLTLEFLSDVLSMEDIGHALNCYGNG